jgi:hypothetical protein
MYIYAPIPVPAPPPAAVLGPLPHAAGAAPGQWTVAAAANPAGLVVGHDYDVTLANPIGPGNGPTRVRCTAVAPPHFGFTVL